MAIGIAALIAACVVACGVDAYRSHRRSQAFKTVPPTMDKCERLDQIAARAKHHREQMEALAAECCELFSVDPEYDTCQRDLCNSIVYHGESPKLVAMRLLAGRSQ